MGRGTARTGLYVAARRAGGAGISGQGWLAHSDTVGFRDTATRSCYAGVTARRGTRPDWEVASVAAGVPGPHSGRRSAGRGAPSQKITNESTAADPRSAMVPS